MPPSSGVPVSSSTSSISTWISWPTCGGSSSSSHSSRGIDAFALVADVDQDHAVVDAENAAFDDLIDVKLTAPFGRGQAFFFKTDDCRFKHRLEVGVVIQIADECSIDHCASKPWA